MANQETVEIINTGLSIGGRVRIRGEVLVLPQTLSSDFPVTIKEQQSYFKNKKVWYVEVGSKEYNRKELYLDEIVAQKTNIFSNVQVISPDWADGQQVTNTELDALEGINPNTNLITINDDETPQMPSNVVTEDPITATLNGDSDDDEESDAEIEVSDSLIESESDDEEDDDDEEEEEIEEKPKPRRTRRKK